MNCHGSTDEIGPVDVVLIACAAKFHPMYLKAGIEAGKHVFVEKPLCSTAAEVEAIADQRGM